jgi:transposase
MKIFHRGQRVASHIRGSRRQQPSTLAEHMPKSHRRYREWTHERIHREAGTIGDDAAGVCQRSCPVPIGWRL